MLRPQIYKLPPRVPLTTTVKDRHCLLNNLFIAMFGNDVEARVTMAAKIIGQKKKSYRLGWGSAAT